MTTFAEQCASHVEGAAGVGTCWRSRPRGEERSLDLDLVEILLVPAGSRGPGTVQLPTMEPASGPGSRWSPLSPEDGCEGGGDLGRQFQELVRVGPPEEPVLPPSWIDSNQPASGP